MALSTPTKQHKDMFKTYLQRAELLDRTKTPGSNFVYAWHLANRTVEELVYKGLDLIELHMRKAGSFFSQELQSMVDQYSVVLADAAGTQVMTRDMFGPAEETDGTGFCGKVEVVRSVTSDTEFVLKPLNLMFSTPGDFTRISKRPPNNVSCPGPRGAGIELLITAALSAESSGRLQPVLGIFLAHEKDQELGRMVLRLYMVLSRAGINVMDAPTKLLQSSLFQSMGMADRVKLLVGITWCLLLSVGRCLMCLSYEGVMHNDMKLENWCIKYQGVRGEAWDEVLLFTQGSMAIIDHGLSKLAKMGKGKNKHVAVYTTPPDYTTGYLTERVHTHWSSKMRGDLDARLGHKVDIRQLAVSCLNFLYYVQDQATGAIQDDFVAYLEAEGCVWGRAEQVVALEQLLQQVLPTLIGPSDTDLKELLSSMLHIALNREERGKRPSAVDVVQAAQPHAQAFSEWVGAQAAAARAEAERTAA